MRQVVDRSRILPRPRRLAIAVDWRSGRLLRREVVRLWGSPTIADMVHKSGGVVHLDYDTFAETICHKTNISLYRRDFEDLVAELAQRRAVDNYPCVFDIGCGTTWALYVHVRSAKPNHVLETGVANGVSSFFILHALRSKGSGLLHSIDVSSDVGRLLTKDERQNWDLHVLDGRSPGKSLLTAFTKLPRLNLFVHDSDHSYRWMRREYDLAARQMVPGGWLTSDDADSSYAFAEFCSRRQLRPTYLFDGRKIFGAVQVV